MSRQAAWYRRVFRFTLVSPRGFLIVAATLTALFLICHVAGWREHTSVLCGQLPKGGAEADWALATGLAYALFYVALVLLVPILTLAAGVFALLQRPIRPNVAESEPK